MAHSTSGKFVGGYAFGPATREIDSLISSGSFWALFTLASLGVLVFGSMMLRLAFSVSRGKGAWLSVSYLVSCILVSAVNFSAASAESDLLLLTFALFFPALILGFLGIVGLLLAVVATQEDPIHVGAKLLNKGSTSKAILSFELAAFDIARHDGLRSVCMQIFQSGEGVMARELARHLTRLSPGDANNWRALSFFEYDTGLKTESMQTLAQAISLDPDNGEIYYDRALRLSREPSRREEALADYTKAISLKTDPKFYANRSALYNEVGRYERALSDAKNAHSLNTQDLVAITQGKRALEALERGDEFHETFDDSVLATLVSPMEPSISGSGDAESQSLADGRVHMRVFAWICQKGDDAQVLANAGHYDEAINEFKEILTYLGANLIIDQFLIGKAYLALFAIAAERGEGLEDLKRGILPIDELLAEFFLGPLAKIRELGILSSNDRQIWERLATGSKQSLIAELSPWDLGLVTPEVLNVLKISCDGSVFCICNLFPAKPPELQPGLENFTLEVRTY